MVLGEWDELGRDVLKAASVIATRELFHAAVIDSTEQSGSKNRTISKLG